MEEEKVTKEDYLRKKGLIPPVAIGVMYIFNSSRKGVDEIIKIDYFEVMEGGYRQTGTGQDAVKELGMVYKMNEYPTLLTLYGDEVVGQEDGYGSGMGDLWGNSQFWSLNESVINNARDEEQARVEKKYLSRVEGTMLFNMNNNIYVKITEEGYQHQANLHNELYKRIGDESNLHTAEHYKAKANEYGYTKFQTWQFMKDFGNTINFGGIPLFDTNIQIEDKSTEF